MTIHETQQFVYNFFYEKKIPHNTIVAIMGNIQGENAVWDISGIEVGGYDGFGLCQWTFNRKTQLLSYGTTLKHQCEFLYSELTGKNLNETKAAFQWISNPSSAVDGGESFECTNKRFLQGKDDIDFLTKAFCYCWERPAYETNHLISIRIPYANTFDETFQYTGNRLSADNYDKNNTTGLTYDGKKATAKDYEITNSIEKAVLWAIKIANDETHGYNQDKRWDGVDYDCSSFVTTAFQNFGFKIREYASDRNITTFNMKNAFINVGFNVVNTDKYMRGDVLLKEDEHVVLYIGDSKIVHASQDENGGVRGGKEGDQTGKEICVRSYYENEWICLRNPHIVYGANNGGGVDSSTNEDSTVKNDNPSSGTPPVMNGNLWKALKQTNYTLAQLTETEINEIKSLDFGDTIKLKHTFCKNKMYVGTSYSGTHIKFDTLTYTVNKLTEKGFVEVQALNGLIKKINPKYIMKERLKRD